MVRLVLFVAAGQGVLDLNAALDHESYFYKRRTGAHLC
jgi:hypothetical protein